MCGVKFFPPVSILILVREERRASHSSVAKPKNQRAFLPRVLSHNTATTAPSRFVCLSRVPRFQRPRGVAPTSTKTTKVRMDLLRMEYVLQRVKSTFQTQRLTLRVRGSHADQLKPRNQVVLVKTVPITAWPRSPQLTSRALPVPDSAGRY